MSAATENVRYKHEDHLFRSADEYANAKYDITADWLGFGRRSLAGMTLANVGCGGGEFNVRAARAGLSVVACEPERGAYELALEASRGTPSIRVWQMGLGELARAVPPLDLLVMHDVLEHIEDEREAVASLAALVKPGGEAVLSVPALQWLFGKHDVELGHHRRYSRARLLPLFASGWTVLRARYYGSLFVPVTLLFSRVLKRPYPTRSVASAPWKRAAFRAACRLQRAVPEPFGTSLLVHLRREPLS